MRPLVNERFISSAARRDRMPFEACRIFFKIRTARFAVSAMAGPMDVPRLNQNHVKGYGEEAPENEAVKKPGLAA